MPVEEMNGAFFVKFLEKSMVWLTEFSLPMISSYHLVIENNFLNEASPKAEGLERVADVTLAPFHYVFGGNYRDAEGEKRLRFDYDSHLLVKSTVSLLALPLSVAVGVPLKCAAAFSHQRNPVLDTFPQRRFLCPFFSHEPLDSPIYARRPGDENNLLEDKAALKEISRLFKKHEIPFWVDCGSCLGVYRYRGAIPWDVDIDVAILQQDHERAKKALQELDPRKYQLQDWSNRSRPGTYLRLYVRGSRAMIDIYHFAVDEKAGTLRYILSNEVSAFLPTSWKVHESRFKVPTPIDVVFPLRPSTLDGIEVFVPHKTKEYLQLRYGENLSPARLFDEKTGNYEKDLSHPYWNTQ